MSGGQSKAELFRILTIIQGKWGQRITDNLREHAPPNWKIGSWVAPRVLPPIVDDPQEFLPPSFEPADLVLALGEIPGLAQLVPDIVHMCGARAVIAPIDRSTALPAGLALQLEQWLDEKGILSVFPKPFCSLGNLEYNLGSNARAYDDPIIHRFVEHFGKPSLHVEVDEGKIARVEVLRDAACGCTRYVANHLVGVEVNEALETGGLLHHHYPCLASMYKEQEYFDTLMHVSGNVLKDSLKTQIKDDLTETYLRPHGLMEDEANPEE
ncbi:MAG TPA: hypothetical protein G4O08_08965 [Anaerolineae bacterium]|nr:hypothetical protein [Anaerolineae bacterium]